MIAQDHLVGSRFEKCVVERLIGRGGYGLTFLAFDEELQEHRVVKVSLDMGIDEAARKRHLKSFVEEGLILSRLKHPQIVTLRGQGDKHGHRYMILDYIQGFSLKTVFDTMAIRQTELGCAWEDLMDPVTASALLLSTLYPLEYAHRANVHLPDREIFGVAHRDISPGNLILGVKGNEKGKLILIDFGTAKTDLTENVTVDQNLVGTVPYMSKARLQKSTSPEQMEEYKDFWRDFRETQNDIHALGVLYYQLLTGKLPFAGETTTQIIVKILDPESYSKCHLDVGSRFAFASSMIRKCLVYHDFNQSLGDQPYQYPDAAAMLPEMEELFFSISSGRTVQEVLIGLGKKMANPELLVPGHDLDALKMSASVEIRALPQPTDYPIPLMPPPMPAGRRIALYLAALAAGTALAVATAWWLRPHASLPLPAEAPKTEAPAEPASGLENLGPEPATSSAPNGSALNGSTPKASLKTNAGAPKPTAKEPNGLRPPEAAGTHAQRMPATMGTASAPATQELSKAESKPSPPASRTANDDGGGEWNKEAFVQVQTLAREDDPSAFEKISGWLNKAPDSPDLRLLKCELILRRNPTSAEARQELHALQSLRPAFYHPNLFHENSLYLLWEADAAIYETQKTPANRINLLKSANAYLSEYQPNPAYEEKVKGIRDRLPK